MLCLPIDSDVVIDVVNLKLSVEMFGSFGTADGVCPACHMNKLHWISVLLPDAPEDVVKFLVNVSFEATKEIRKRRKDCSITQKGGSHEPSFSSADKTI